jgi:hypothetical protein
MIHPTELGTLLAILVVLTVFEICWLWFMIAKPERWSRFVDRENDFWVKRGIVSASLSERFKKFEKGLGQKILVGTGALLGMAALVGAFIILLWYHYRHG